MGFIKDETGFTMFGGVPEGTCKICAVKHDETQPHNQQSLTYQYKFYDQFGRWPTWKDAMNHCSDQVKEQWTTELEKRGVEVE